MTNSEITEDNIITHSNAGDFMPVDKDVIMEITLRGDAEQLKQKIITALRLLDGIEKFEWEESITIELRASGMPKQFQQKIITALRLLDGMEKFAKGWKGYECIDIRVNEVLEILNQAKGEKK